jgi:uncharacterized membrane protein
MNSFLKKIVWLVVTLPPVFLWIVWKQLPQTIATHFDLHGNPDEFSSKNQLVISTGVLALMSVLLFLVVSNAYRFDPKKRASDNKDRLLRIAFTSAVLLAVVSCTIIYAALGGGLRFNIRFIFTAMGLFWAVLGNYMYNIKPNYFAGFRLPWTLESEENWRRTHMLGGRIWFGGGLLLAALSAFLPEKVSIVVFMAGSFCLVVIPIVYSYSLFRKQQKNKPA